MAYSFTPTIKPFVISSLYDSIKAARPARRLPNTSYIMGVQVVNSNNRYICIQAGVTGAGSGPSGSTGAFFDGSVRWLAMGPDPVQDGDIISNLYIGLGKQEEWSNPSVPDAPNTSYNGEREALDDATAFLRLDATNLRLGIANAGWTSGTAYSQYDPDTNQLNYPTSHYCIVGNTFVYKCLDNNGGANSVDAPSGVATSLIETADGYIWKYVGEITNSEQFDFSTTQFVPAPNGIAVGSYVQGEISTFNALVTAGDSFDESVDIEVIVVGNGAGSSAAARAAVAGGSKTITGLYATAGGSGYTEAFAIAGDAAAVGGGAEVEVEVDSGVIDSISVTETGVDYDDAVVVIIGDGTGAEATANIVSGALTSVTIDDPGTGYTWARAFVIAGTGGAVAKAVFSPTNGHGSNIVTELGVKALLISTKLTPALNAYIPTEPTAEDGSFRQVTLVSGVQGDASSDRNAEAYLGKSHYLYDSVEDLNKYKDGSGYVLYINNISAIIHTSSQEEIIKISISL